MNPTFNGKIALRADSKANWLAATPYKPLNGEICIIWEDNIPKFKIGNGADYIFNNGAQELPWASISVDSTIQANSNNAVSSSAVYAAIEKLSGATYVTVTKSGDNYVGDKTFDEIKALIENGKQVYVKFEQLVIPFVGMGVTSSGSLDDGTTSTAVSSIYFQGILGNNLYLFICEDTGDWDYVSDSNITMSILDQSLAAEATTTAPSSGAVYAAVQEVKSKIPNVSSWALKTSKPEYTAAEVGAEEAGTTASAISEHNVSAAAHNDIRDAIKTLSDNLSALVQGAPEDLDTLAEIVDYIKKNKTLIDDVTTNKVNKSDIVNNLETNVSDKPLSAAQGVTLNQTLSNLSTVASSGSYNDLKDKPTILQQAYNGFNGAIVAGSDGVAEYGRYMDFHYEQDTMSDYSTRVTCTGDYSNNVNLPSGDGTFIIGDKSYKIVTSSTAPIDADASKGIITLVI